MASAYLPPSRTNPAIARRHLARLRQEHGSEALANLSDEELAVLERVTEQTLERLPDTERSRLAPLLDVIHTHRALRGRYRWLAGRANDRR